MVAKTSNADTSQGRCAIIVHVTSSIRETVVFFAAMFAAFAPLFLLAAGIGMLGGPDPDSTVMRLATIGAAVLVGVLFSLAYRDVSAMDESELAEVETRARARARWWEVALAGIVAGSWTYVLLMAAGRVLERLGLVSFPLSMPIVAGFVVASIAAALAGAAWWARPISA